MFKRISPAELILLVLAFMSLVYSELMWFNDEKEGALFVGLWVPTILGFAIYLKLLKMDNK